MPPCVVPSGESVFSVDLGSGEAAPLLDITLHSNEVLDAQLAEAVLSCTVVGKGDWWKIQGPEASGLDAFARQTIGWS
jgi:hypothetical protein